MRLFKKLVASCLFSFKRIEMEKMVFFTFLRPEQTIHLANTSLSQSQTSLSQSLFESFAGQILPNLLFTGSSISFLDTIRFFI